MKLEIVRARPTDNPAYIASVEDALWLHTFRSSCQTGLHLRMSQTQVAIAQGIVRSFRNAHPQRYIEEVLPQRSCGRVV